MCLAKIRSRNRRGPNREICNGLPWPRELSEKSEASRSIASLRNWRYLLQNSGRTSRGQEAREPSAGREISISNTHAAIDPNQSRPYELPFVTVNCTVALGAMISHVSLQCRGAQKEKIGWRNFRA